MNVNNRFLYRSARIAISMCAGLLVFGTTISNANPVDPVSNPSKLEYPDVIMTIPDYDEPFQREGIMSRPELFETIVPEMPSQQVVDLIGQPLSIEQGRLGVEWNYNFTFVIPASQHHMVCQYKVVFDAEHRVKDSVWRRHQCLDIVRTASLGKQ